MKSIPDELTQAPFLRSHALEAGVSAKMLRGQRFVRPAHPRVYVARAHAMTWEDLVLAGRLALPDRST